MYLYCPRANNVLLVILWQWEMSRQCNWRGKELREGGGGGSCYKLDVNNLYTMKGDWEGGEGYE